MHTSVLGLGWVPRRVAKLLMMDRADCGLGADCRRAHTARVAEVVLEPLHVDDIASGKGCGEKVIGKWEMMWCARAGDSDDMMLVW